MKAAAAILTAGLAAIGVWSPMLGGSVALVVPVMIAAALVTARVLRVRGPILMLAWCCAAVLIAGEPARWLWPAHWGGLISRLADGAQQLPLLLQQTADSRWPLTVWLILTGTMLLAGAGMATLVPQSTIVRIIGFLLILLPWAAGTGLRQADEPAWLGLVVLLTILLWWSPSGSRARLVPVIALATAAALLAMAVTQVAGPRRPWVRLHGLAAAQPRFTTLSTRQSYGPLNDRRTGATMLEITADQPALWRVQSLDRFSFRGWDLDPDPEPELPQPSAITENIQVQVKGLRQDLVVSPGRIVSVESQGDTKDMDGEAFRIEPTPQNGDTYQVQAEVVQSDAGVLRTIPSSSDSRLEQYTTIGGGFGGFGGPVLVGHFGQSPSTRTVRNRFSDGLGRSRAFGFGRFQDVIDLADRLSVGAKTPFEVVERVQHYLVDSGIFRYTTQVSDAGMMPLVDFLTTTHEGYCQHFAGAAAMLLRLAGVPTRVVAGFATGESDGNGHYRVRDLDAHAWIEVYFAGVGWVPFNPTPAAAPAAVPAAVDPLSPPAAAADLSDRLAAPATVALLTLLLLAAGVAGRRRTRRDLVAVLEGLTGRTGGTVQPSTTLAELRRHLAGIGPHTEALAAEAERARFAPGPTPPPRHPRVRVVRALSQDLGPIKTVRLLTRI